MNALEIQIDIAHIRRKQADCEYWRESCARYAWEQWLQRANSYAVSYAPGLIADLADAREIIDHGLKTWKETRN